MKLRYTLLVLAIFAASFAVIGCSGPASTSYQNVSVSLSYYPVCNGCTTGSLTYVPVPYNSGGLNGTVICSPASAYCLNQGTVQCLPTTETCITSGAVAVPPGGGSGGCIQLFVTVANAPVNPTWTIVPSPVVTAATSNVGSVASPNGATNFYCEPSSIPIYSGAQLAQARAAGIPQGTTEVIVTNPADPNNPSNVVSAHMYFSYQLVSSSLPGGIAIGINQAPSVSIPLSSTTQFTGYVAGINGYIVPTGVTAPTGGCITAIAGQCIPATSQTWAVSACTATGVTGAPLLSGGNYGTINTTTGLYTAPAAYPASTAKCANITTTSAAYPTIVSAVTTVFFQ